MTWFGLTQTEGELGRSNDPPCSESPRRSAAGLNYLLGCARQAVSSIVGARPAVDREMAETARTQSMHPLTDRPWGEPARGGVDLSSGSEPGRRAPDPRARYALSGWPMAAAMTAQTGGAGRLSGPALDEQRRGVGSALGGDGGVGGPANNDGQRPSNLMRSGAVGASQLPMRTARPSPGRKHRGW